MTTQAEALQQVTEIRRHAAKARRIVFVSGNFNTVHPGHLRLLRFAADCGDFLVVGVNDNTSDRALLPEDLRLDGVRSISFVNHAFILREPPERFIPRLRPAIVVKGKEHEAHSNPEKRAVEKHGGKLLFSSGEMRFSSIDLLKKEFLESNLSSITKPLDFPRRHGFTMADLRKTMSRFNGLRVTVVGELIVDEYIACDPLGMSQEDPTLVVAPIQQEKFIGGAAIVAAHARKLGAKVRYFSVCGRDAPAAFAREKLHEYGVNAEVFEDESRPTTLKQRFRAEGKTLLRVSHLRQHDITQDLMKSVLAAIRKAIASTDLLIFSDFNYGCLPQPLVEATVNICKEKGVMMVADSQSSSQVGDVSRFKGMLLLTPTEREARLAVRDFNSGLVVLAETLRKKSHAKNIILTLGAEGLLMHAQTKRKNEWLTDRLPSFNTSPKDTAGAGDSLLTCCSMGMAVGADIWQSAYLGSIAAACQVSRVGNIPLSPRDLEVELAD